MKRKIKWIISLSLIAGILCFLYFLLPYPRKVWMIAHYLKSFPTRAYSVSHWGIIQNDSSETDILSFECHIYRNDEILETVLELKKDLEAYLADNAELYHNTTITLHFETDAADLDYVLTTSGSNAKNPLLFGYGVFHDGELHSLEAFRNTSEFISLELVSTSNPNNRHFDYTALDNQTELEMLHLENMNLSADQLQYLIDKHPNCKIKASVKIKPLLDELFARLETVQVSGKSALAKAVRYALHEKPFFYTFLQNGNVSPDNNRAQNAIRPFAIGRKNWLFSNTANGAKASAVLYSIAATAQANGVDTEQYLTKLFSQPVGTISLPFNT